MIEAPAAPLYALGIKQADRYPLWSLLDMLIYYAPLYDIATKLGKQLSVTSLLRDSKGTLSDLETDNFRELLDAIQRECKNFGFDHTAKLAARLLERFPPAARVALNEQLNFLDDSLRTALETESFFRIPLERKGYYERDEAFGAEVAAAFPSCERDMRKAGSCYALGQEDGCVHHLMLVLERGLNALAAKVNVPYQRTNWDVIIRKIQSEIGPMPKGPQKDFYVEVSAQFGFLKDAYRNHAEHARDDHYDLPKALSIWTHVRSFMRELAKGGLTE